MDTQQIEQWAITEARALGQICIPIWTKLFKLTDEGECGCIEFTPELHARTFPTPLLKTTLEAFKALVKKTEECDNVGDYGVGSDDNVMIEARRAIAEEEAR